MTSEQIQGYIQIAGLLASMGVDIIGKIKTMVSLFHGADALTEDQINAIERAGIADAERRKQERIAMGQPSEAQG